MSTWSGCGSALRCVDSTGRGARAAIRARTPRRPADGDEVAPLHGGEAGIVAGAVPGRALRGSGRFRSGGGGGRGPAAGSRERLTRTRSSGVASQPRQPPTCRSSASVPSDPPERHPPPRPFRRIRPVSPPVAHPTPPLRMCGAGCYGHGRRYRWGRTSWSPPRTGGAVETRAHRTAAGGVEPHHVDGHVERMGVATPEHDPFER